MDYSSNIPQKIHLYIHIPFCKNCCPYCPYNKVPVDAQLVELFFKALEEEIELYYKTKGVLHITSIYFGGGSPAMFPEKIAKVIEHIARRFSIEGEICIEINPNDCISKNLKTLKNAGIQTVSIGVQSFQDMNLKIIGRSYNGITAEKSVQNVLSIFDSVNIDLMFALPNQDIRSLQYDLAKAIQFGANQITTYPLFTFPYTSVGNYMKLKDVKMPNMQTRKNQYYNIYDTLIENSYNQVSVWSFKIGTGSKYSSVTRHGYLGFGVSAGSHLLDGFYLNTFSINSYADKLAKQEFPTALKFEMDKNLTDLFWLYWRFYDTRIPVSEFDKRFKENKKVKRLISLLGMMNLISKNENEYLLTRKGSFWLHLAQNYFSLNYINKIWGNAMQSAFPKKIKF